jgi:hypothetical protein
VKRLTTKLKAEVEARLRAGMEIVTVEVGPQPHSWLPFAGMFKDDPDFKDVLAIMEEHRRQIDEDAKTP